MGKSSEFDLAYDEAMDNAYASAAVKCSALVERESNPKGDSKSGRGSRGYLKNVQFKKVLFNISDPEVIKMEYTDGPIFEVEVCLQFEAENIVKQAKEDYPELNQQDIEELRTIFRQK